MVTQSVKACPSLLSDKVSSTEAEQLLYVCRSVLVTSQCMHCISAVGRTLV